MAASSLEGRLGVLRRVRQGDLGLRASAPASGWRASVSSWLRAFRAAPSPRVASEGREGTESLLTLRLGEGVPPRLVLDGSAGPGEPLEWRLLNDTGAALWLLFVETSTEGRVTVLPEESLAEAPRIEAGETFVLALGASRSATLERLLVLGFERLPWGHSSQLFEAGDALQRLRPQATAILEVERAG